MNKNDYLRLCMNCGHTLDNNNKKYCTYNSIINPVKLSQLKSCPKLQEECQKIKNHACVLHESILPSDNLILTYFEDGLQEISVIKGVKYCPNCGVKILNHKRLRGFNGKAH